jgi:hypothetical protein
MRDFQPASVHRFGGRHSGHFHPTFVHVKAVSVAVVHENADGRCGAKRAEQLFAFLKRFLSFNALADVAVHPKLAAQHAIHKERYAERFNVNQVTVFVPAPHDGMARFSRHNLASEGTCFVPKICGRDQVVDRLACHFVSSVTKEIAERTIA